MLTAKSSVSRDPTRWVLRRKRYLQTMTSHQIPIKPTNTLLYPTCKNIYPTVKIFSNPLLCQPTNPRSVSHVSFTKHTNSRLNGNCAMRNFEIITNTSKNSFGRKTVDLDKSTAHTGGQVSPNPWKQCPVVVQTVFFTTKEITFQIKNVAIKKFSKMIKRYTMWFYVTHSPFSRG